MVITLYPPCKKTLALSYREMQQQVVFRSYTQLHWSMYINTYNAWKSLSIYRCNILQTAHFLQQMALTAFPVTEKNKIKKILQEKLLSAASLKIGTSRTARENFPCPIQLLHLQANSRYTYCMFASAFLAERNQIYPLQRSLPCTTLSPKTAQSSEVKLLHPLGRELKKGNTW